MVDEIQLDPSAAQALAVALEKASTQGGKLRIETQAVSDALRSMGVVVGNVVGGLGNLGDKAEKATENLKEITNTEAWRSLSDIINSTEKNIGKLAAGALILDALLAKLL